MADNYEQLLTPFGETLDKNKPLQEYPRPQLKRDSYLNLNGYWDYAIYPKESKFDGYQGKIVVPFSPESALSDVNRSLTPDQYLFYKKDFEIPFDFNKGRIILHFGAVDYMATIFINGNEVGMHKGGYTPFSFDITDYLLDGVNQLELKVSDPTDTGTQGRGKQKLEHGGIFYTHQSGIWQTVWMESVPIQYIKNIKIIPNIDNNSVLISANTNITSAISVSVWDEDKVIASAVMQNGSTEIKLSNYTCWTPETPKLYNLTIEGGEDKVESYFGMRKFSLGYDQKGNVRIMLNNQPYFNNGLLDQGYYPDGLYTPPSDQAMIYDISTMKAMGFNMLRKHIKVEPLRWYYHCDRLGMIVWQDMVNGGGKCNTAINGICGFLGIKVKDDGNYKITNRQDQEGREQYFAETDETMTSLFNVVSIGVWVPFNESWGQFDAVKTLEFVTNRDKTRLVDHASGWHDQGVGDFNSLHIYFRPITIPKKDKNGRCIVLSEFGGYSYGVTGHVYSTKKSFGYRKYTTPDDLAKAYQKLFDKQIIPLIDKGLSATVYTQVSDVEEEINGLLTYDRKVIKIPIETIKKINEKVKI